MEDNIETVFILGAGASYEFGFPTGEGLIDEINEVCNGIGLAITFRINNFPRYSGYDPGSNTGQSYYKLYFKVIKWAEANFYDPMFTLREAIKRLQSGIALSKSIDNFLNDQNDPEFTNLCKIIICITLLEAERNGPQEINEKRRNDFVPLYNGVDSDNRKVPPDFFGLRQTWLVTFFRELRSDNGRDGEGMEALKERLQKIAIITFNYERSFEYFMRNAFKAYQSNLTPAELDELMGVLNEQIIHPYGTLGSLDDLPFADEINNINDLSVFIDRIKIFTEAGENKERAQNWVKCAKRLVFMGFGFHEQNMEYLGITKNPNNGGRKIYATAYNVSEYRQYVLHKRLNPMWVDQPLVKKRANQRIFIVPDTCKTLLEEYADETFPS